MTSFLDNAALTAQGSWSITDDASHRIGDDSTYSFDANGFEMFERAEALSQTISVPNGLYKVTVNAFLREGEAEKLYGLANTSSVTNVSYAYLKANDYQTQIAAWANHATSTTSGETTNYTPNSKAEAVTAFSSGDYLNEVYTYVSDGTLTITIAQPGKLWGCWLMAKDVTITRYDNPSAVGAVTLNASIDFSNAISDGSVAGAVNSMALSNLSGDNKFELGYTSGDPATTVLGDVLRVGNGTGTVTIPDAQLAGARDEVVITFDYYFGHLSGKKAGFYLKDASSKTIGALYFTPFNRETPADINSFGFDYSYTNMPNQKTSGSTDNANICIDTYKITFELHLDYAAGTMYAKQYTNGTLKQTTTSVTLGSTDPLKTFEIKSDYNNDSAYGRRCWFDNLKIYTVKGDYSVADVAYTVKFVDGDGNKVKEDVTDRTAAPGTGIAALATAADQTTFYNDGDIENNTDSETGMTNKYVYSSVSAKNSSNGVITELEADATVTIVYTKYTKYDYTMKQKLGTADATDLHTGSLWGDQTVTYYYPVCVKDGDNYYVTDANGSTPSFGQVISLSNANPVINYTLDERIVYYAEAETMGGERYNYDNVPNLASNGAAYCSKAATDSYQVTTWENPAAGNYDIEVGMGARKAATITPQLKSSESGEAATPALESITLSENSYTVKTYINQPIAAGEQLYFYNNNNPNASTWALDYVILRNIPANVSVTVTDAGMATYVNSDYDLDFSSTDIEAYKVKVSKKGVATLTKVNNVPAGTPVLLVKEGGETENIPTTTGAAAVSDNDLVAGTGAAVATDGGTVGEVAYTNMILNKVDGNVGFYFANGKTVATNRAYLHIASSFAPDAESGGEARRMVMVFDGEATSISTVLGEGTKANGYYNLNGQRVTAPQKGLYIVNGKKVVVK